MEEKPGWLRLMSDVEETEDQMEQCAVMSERRSDEQLIAACRRGDRDAFRQLFEIYQDRVYSIALYFFSGDEASAKDITQLVFLKLITRIEQFRSDAEFTTWLYRLVANACLDEQRRRKRWISFGEAIEVNTMVERRTHEERYIRLEVADSVRAAVATLKPKLRLVILLKYFEELSYEEMAQVLGCSPGTVASRLNRAHKALARKLGHLRDAVAPAE
ncbi:MAG: sigma-70 family RNA polymerase sigma factor [Acidobacteria bacterium]|nr:sigma-70 family RNA polymerase sigma factor [Acidobacteriota bacterium]